MATRVGIDDLQAAARRLTGVAHRTPVATCTTLDRLSGRHLFFKCEHLQKVGAFKFRGAWNVVSQLDAATAARGVVTHSSGNHAQALALAAARRGIAAHVVMPRGAPTVKRDAVAGYGARIVACEPTLQARESTAAQIVAATGAVFVHPYDDPSIVAGQGTAALELLADVPDLDAVVAPVGGGGLLSGTAIAVRAVAPGAVVVGAEPAAADDAARSLAAGRLLPPVEHPRTLADGLLTGLGEVTWPLIRDHVDGIVTVDEDALVAAMRLLWQRAKLPVEPSSAVALAAVLSDPPQLAGRRRVGIILSGGNVDLAHLCREGILELW